ncbi:MAG TPA: hypothetical protein PK110_15245 [Niabella sp.]|jgi:hypothetical protein|nr:hypothetical protein [Chitinophagaceae bacterium]HRN48991.1 hypothetical protein [Niabella sp.]HRO86178.1 hypothetical protein [Niabella sp.]HUN03926.1 hypothetical protein [Niabella sp.]
MMNRDFSVAFKATEKYVSIFDEYPRNSYFSDVDKKYFRLSHVTVA